MVVTKSNQKKIQVLKSVVPIKLINLKFDSLGQLIKSNELEKEIMQFAQLLFLCLPIKDFYVVYDRVVQGSQQLSYFVKYDAKNDKTSVGHVV